MRNRVNNLYKDYPRAVFTTDLSKVVVLVVFVVCGVLWLLVDWLPSPVTKYLLL